MANQGIKKEGNLEKKSRYLGVWRKRWTVLQPKSTTTSSVSTYKKPKQYKSPTECIRIDNQTDIVAYPASEDKGELLFYIQNVRDKERFLFKAESKHDRDEWIKCITNANKKKDKKDLKDIINGTETQQQNNTDDSYDIKTEPSTDNTPNNAQKIDNNDDNKIDNNESKPIEKEPKPTDDDQKDKQQVVDNKLVTQTEPPKEVVQEQAVDNKVDVIKTEIVNDNNNNENEQGQQQEQQKEEIINKEVVKVVKEVVKEVVKGIESVKTTETIPPINDENKPIEQHKEQIQNKETDIVKKVENEIDEKKDEQKPKEYEITPEPPKEDVKVDDSQPPKEEPPKQEEPPKEAPVEEPPKEEVKADDPQPPKEEAPVEEPPVEETVQEEVINNENEEAVVNNENEEAPVEVVNNEKEEPPKEAPVEEAPKEKEPKEEVVNNENENEEVVQEEVIKDEEKEEVEPQPIETEVKPEENNDNNEEVQNEEQKQKEVIDQNNETETQPKPQQDVQQQQSEQQPEEQPEEKNDNNENKETVVKPSGLTAAIAQVKAQQDDTGRTEAEDKFPTDSKTTPVFNPSADDKLDKQKIDKQNSDPQESHSQASSYTSDDGDAPFGNRWGFGLNDTMEDDSDANDIDVDEKKEDIDTTNMEYISVVVIGNKQSGKTLLVNTLLDNKNEEQKYEQTNDNVISNKVFAGSDDEKDEDVSGILCSFVDTSGDIMNLQKTVSGISICDIAIVMISIEQDIDNVREYIRILNTYGIDKYICCLGYMDNIDYNKDKYETVQGKVEKMFKKIGIKAKKIAFIPVNCKGGDNICTASVNDKLGWYKGWTLKKKTGMTVLDAIRTITIDAKKHKKESEPFIMAISNNKDGIIYGKIEQGTLNKGDKVKLTSSDNMVSISEIKRCGQIMNKCIQGDYININIDSNNDDNVHNGDVLYMDNDDNKLNIKPCKSITALVVVSGINKLEIGFKGLICIRSSMVIGEISNINWVGDKKNTNVKYLGDKEQGEVVFKFENGIIGTTYDVCESLGRFVVINENKVVLVGKIESVEC